MICGEKWTVYPSNEANPFGFLDPSKDLGFDIFDEVEDQPVGNIAPWD
jgi:hypothetical protein